MDNRELDRLRALKTDLDAQLSRAYAELSNITVQHTKELKDEFRRHEQEIDRLSSLFGMMTDGIYRKQGTILAEVYKVMAAIEAEETK